MCIRDRGMSAFGGISPTYHIALAENAPVIVWNFHSLLVMIQMCFSFMLTDSDCDMKLCKHLSLIHIFFYSFLL